MRWKELCPRNSEGWVLILGLPLVSSRNLVMLISLRLRLFLCKLGSWNLGKHGSLLQLAGGIYKLDNLAFSPAD